MCENPWLDLTAGAIRIAACDKRYFEQHYGSAEAFAAQINGRDSQIELTFDCLPEPYSGNPASRVYCLNQNPGRPDPCFVGEEAFEQAALANLRLQAPSCFWLDPIKNRCGKRHDGAIWLEKRTNRLTERIGCRPELFFVEYFPYHSTRGNFNFPKELPSYDFSDDLIRQAIEAEKLLLIMREEKRWRQRIAQLRTKKEPRIYTLRSKQCGYLSPDNIVRVDERGEMHALTEKEFDEFRPTQQ